MTRQGQRSFAQGERPLVLLATDNNIHDQAKRAIFEQAQLFGWDMLDLRFTRGTFPDYRRPRGAITTCLPTDPLARQLREMGVPAVRMGRLPHPDDDLLPVVIPSNIIAGRLAAEHFAERHFQNVAYVGYNPWSMLKSMYEAFRDRSTELGCKCHLLRLRRRPDRNMSDEEVYRHRSSEIGQWLKKLPKPVGLLCFNDLEAGRTCTMCFQESMQIPEDVALLSIGNSELDCMTAPVTLSSIDLARDEMGRRAAILLDSIMKGMPAPEAPIVVEARGVVARRSTDVLAVGDATVAQTMRFMWDHLAENLSVDDISAQVGIPRRKLERAFRVHLKRGVNAELLRKRLEYCCQLLRTSDETITDIAVLCGFRSGDYLHVAFKKAYGITPRQYRMGQDYQRKPVLKLA